jgi:hypothetical protein
MKEISASIIAKQTDNIAELKQNHECHKNNVTKIEGSQEQQDKEESKNEEKIKEK